MEQIKGDSKGFQIIATDDPHAALESNKANAILTFSDGFEQKALTAESPQATLDVNRSRSSTPFVESKIDNLLRDYERWVVRQRLKVRLKPEYAGNAAETLQPIQVQTTDVATSEQRMGKMLAIILPVLLLLTGMLGALFPALNATTNERELGTLETLLVTPAGRMEILCARACSC